jgi:uroporphyrinogen decarboxylase
MNKRERIKAALAGSRVDRVPVAFWRHWPEDDQREEALTLVTLEFQRIYDLDFIKFPSSSPSTVADYGAKHEYRGSLLGSRVYTENVIKCADDWKRIEPLDVHRGVYGWNLRALQKVIDQKDPETPIIVTMFDPLALACNLAGEKTCLAHMRTHPQLLAAALGALTETCVAYARAAIDAKADGVFLSTPHASYDLMNQVEYQQFGRPGDLAVLAAAAGGWFNVLHVHGPHPMLPVAYDYPAHALNWDDRIAYPDMAEAAKHFKGALMGGVDQYRVLEKGSMEDVVTQVHDTVRLMNGRRLIVTPGCTYPIDVPHSNLAAMRHAVEAY